MAFLDETGVENLTADIKTLADARYAPIDCIKGNYSTDRGYCKLKDGTLICWGTFSCSVPTANWTAWGSLVTGQVILNHNFAVPFANGDVAIAFTINNTVWAFPIEYHCNQYGITTFCMGRPTANAGSQLWRYIAIGRWQ